MDRDFPDLIGRSPALADVLDQARRVAQTDATALILGETGSGKELVARAVHRFSPRNANSFIKVNCAAIPADLLESELFGHERGAFTGAIQRKKGRFELANKGTIFLDEIGAISPALQPKLLRVLQEKEFERLGGVQTIKVDVRVVAATNDDLAGKVAARHFRSDLYYRLHVFPIRTPPLRERREDIPLLAYHFLKIFSRSASKQIETIAPEGMEILMHWDWPGNVRELENVIHRSVLLTQGPALQVLPFAKR